MLRRASLTTPLVLLLAAAGCSSADPQPANLHASFPDHAKRITDTGRTFDTVGDSYVLMPERARWGPSQLAVALPKNGLAPVRMRLDAINMEFTVTEIDLAGDDAVRDGDAIKYVREGGTSFWAGVPGGVEEWLVLDGGVKDYRVPVASWIVSGATPKQMGPMVVIYGSDGRAHLRVRADEAYGPTGEELGTRLAVVGDRIDLYVAESPGPVLIDPEWVDNASLNDPRGYHAATLLLDDRVLVAGGADTYGVDSPIDTAEIYDADVNTWTMTDSLFDPRMYLSLNTLDDGNAIANGGDDGFGYGMGYYEIFDPTGNTGAGAWTSSGSVCCYSAGFHTATKLGNDQVLYTGGVDGNSSGGSAFTCVEVFDNNLDQMLCEGDLGGSGQFGLLDPRLGHTATLLLNGDVLITGGGSFFGGSAWHTEIRDGTSLEFSSGPSMNYERAFHTATRLCNGDVLVVGGIGSLPSVAGIGPGGGALATAEIFNGTNFTEVNGGLMTARFGHTASLMPDCRVLIVGGYQDNGNSTDTAEIYDPVQDVWALAPSLPTFIRGNHTATTLGNGDVLVAGGRDTSSQTENDDPVGDSWEFQNLLPDGDNCTAGDQCLSGFCADGVCCDTMCDTVCQSCTDALKETTDGDGVCGATAAGTDPDGECNAAQCGSDEVLNPDTCNGSSGAPACVDGGITDCAPYTCDATTVSCKALCVTKLDCAGNHYCNTSTSTCVPQKPLGDPATFNEECQSGIVADGVCCDSACNNGVCDACSIAAGGTTDGTCEPITTCSDDNECTIDACHPFNGCISNSVLDGTPCTGGVCVAGTCIPDPELEGTGGEGGGSTSSGSGGDDENESTGAAGDPVGDPFLEGGGICQARIAGGPDNEKEQPLWLLLGLAPFIRRRRR